MNKNTKLELAVEIMAVKLAKVAREDATENEINLLLSEKTLMYQGNEKIINKIIDVYGKEIGE